MALPDTLVLLLNQCIPLGATMLNNHLSQVNSERIRAIRVQELGEREKVVLKHRNHDPESFKLHINDEIPEVPEFEFKQGEGIDEVGSRMWSTYHDLSLQLPEHATQSQVRVFLRKVERSMRNHPCEECRTNISKHLKSFKMTGTSKKEAVKKIFEIHNKVNKALDKPTFSSDQFKKTYHYSIE